MITVGVKVMSMGLLRIFLLSHVANKMDISLVRIFNDLGMRECGRFRVVRLVSLF